MARVDRILELIDGTLTGDTGPDAVRWSPEPVEQTSGERLAALLDLCNWPTPTPSPPRGDATDDSPRHWYRLPD